jgi:hypothetical protein
MLLKRSLSEHASSQTSAKVRGGNSMAFWVKQYCKLEHEIAIKCAQSLLVLFVHPLNGFGCFIRATTERPEAL